MVALPESWQALRVITLVKRKGLSGHLIDDGLTKAATSSKCLPEVRPFARGGSFSTWLKDHLELFQWWLLYQRSSRVRMRHQPRISYSKCFKNISLIVD